MKITMSKKLFFYIIDKKNLRNYGGFTYIAIFACQVWLFYAEDT